MITETKISHYLAVKNISRLLHGFSSKHKVDRYCNNCLRSFRIEEKLKSYEKVCNNHEKHGFNKDEDPVKMFGRDLRGHSKEMINATKGKYCH